MATDTEWERITRAAETAGMELSRFIVHRVLIPDSLPQEVMGLTYRQHKRLEAQASRSAGRH